MLQDDEFFCWRSAGKVCIPAASQCDYHADCPQEEDEDGCGKTPEALSVSGLEKLLHVTMQRHLLGMNIQPDQLFETVL